MARVFQFSVYGGVSIDLDDVVFTDPEGNSVDVSALTNDEIFEKVNAGELDWDWLQIYRDSMNTNLQVDDVEIIEG